MFNVLQIELTDALYNEINADGGTGPKAVARSAAIINADVERAAALMMYAHVADVNTDDMDDAFEVMNLWNDEDKVTRHGQVHSLSVGDILVKPGTFDAYVVAPVGFKKLDDHLSRLVVGLTEFTR